MKILFLDIDGVLNNRDTIAMGGLNEITPSKLELLKQIVDATDVQLVLSSDWRHSDADLRLVVAALRTVGLELFSITPYLRGKPRWEEINEWLNNPYFETHKVEKIAIVDDENSAGEDRPGCFFKTEFVTGLTPEIAQDIITFLNGD